MKAILKEDKIAYLTDRPSAVEIGDIPRGVDLGRLRFDGNQVLDLAEQIRFWVRQIGPGAFEFHVIEVPGSQYVEMAWRDRKHLINDAGTIRVMTQEEIDAAEQAEYDRQETVRQYNERFGFDDILRRFVTARPDQIEAFIDANVTDLQSAKAALKKLAVILRYVVEKVK